MGSWTEKSGWEPPYFFVRGLLLKLKYFGLFIFFTCGIRYLEVELLSFETHRIIIVLKILQYIHADN